MADSVVVVVPLSRPSMVPNVLENFERQTFQAKRLLIVENGRALGHWQGPGEVLRAPGVASAGAAKNVALAHLRASLPESRNFVSIFDDDDYYGPRYLEEQVQVLSQGKYPIVGKAQHFIEDDRGFWLLNRYVSSCEYDWCCGGTQTFDLARVRTFLEKPVGEDVHFVRDVETRGERLFVTSPFGFLWNRKGSDHVFQRDAVARAIDWGLHVLYLGPKVDFAVVNGEKPVRAQSSPLHAPGGYMRSPVPAW